MAVSYRFWKTLLREKPEDEFVPNK
jgi:hypothetical protein